MEEADKGRRERGCRQEEGETEILVKLCRVCQTNKQGKLVTLVGGEGIEGIEGGTLEKSALLQFVTSAGRYKERLLIKEKLPNMKEKKENN